MSGRATVLQVNDREVTLEIGSVAACGGCTACGLFAERRPQTLRSANPRGLALQPGDVVEIEFAPGRAVRAAFFVLIVPLILFLGAFAAVRALGVASEPLQVLAGVAGLAAGLALAWLRGRGSTDLPEVARVVRDAAARHPVCDAAPAGPTAE